MVSSSATALRATRSSYLRLAVAWRATPLQLLWSFYLPATLSHLIVALRAAVPLALIVTVAADMLIATDAGIGRILMDSLAVFDTKKLYAGVIVVGALGYVAATISSFVERKTMHWSGS
jgi:ABC-type nitrate/sulfonate/bicarbonate transport system permease component